MIISQGIDIVEINRIKQSYDRYKNRFLNKIFTKDEIKYCFKKRNPYESLAGRFAAKEACVKVLSIAGDIIYSYKQIEIIRAKNGFVTYKLTKQAETIFKKLKADRIHLSITHEKHYSIASCILEK